MPPMKLIREDVMRGHRSTLVHIVTLLVVVLALPMGAAGAGVLELISTDAVPGGSSTPAGSSRPPARGAVSDDGRYVVFLSDAPNVVPGQSGLLRENVFVRDRYAGTTTLVSRSAIDPLRGEGGANPSISANGAWVV